jgi:hypothetical protein
MRSRGTDDRQCFKPERKGMVVELSWSWSAESEAECFGLFYTGVVSLLRSRSASAVSVTRSTSG